MKSLWRNGETWIIVVIERVFFIACISRLLLCNLKGAYNLGPPFCWSSWHTLRLIASGIQGSETKGAVHSLTRYGRGRVCYQPFSEQVENRSKFILNWENWRSINFPVAVHVKIRLTNFSQYWGSTKASWSCGCYGRGGDFHSSDMWMMSVIWF